jgi:pilus assembly protein Flp/PilA
VRSTWAGIFRNGPILGPVTQGVFLLIYLYAKARALWATRDQGASAVEYGLLIAGIAALIVLVVFAFGSQIRGIFTDTCSSVINNGTSDGTCPAAP